MTSSRLLQLGLLLLFLGVSGCGLGGVDNRLVGRWETRKGFAKSTVMHLKADGSAEVVVSENQKAGKPITGSWGVTGESGGKLVVQIRLSGQTQQRTIKFLNDDLLEMHDGSGGVTKYARMGS